MPEISVKDQIRKLVELQKIDVEIYAFKKELKEKPNFIEGLKNEFEGKKLRLKGLEDKLKAVLLARKDHELELKVKEEAITKANGQLFQLKTNKEYTVKLAEIESLKADKSIIEEKILISFDEYDTMGREIEKEKARVGEEEKKFLAQKKETEIEIKLTEDRVRVLESQRKQMLDGVDPVYLSRYERILLHKEGLAIVAVREHTCGGCYMNVPQQTSNAIKMHDRLVECEMCARILYLEDDL